MKEAIRAVEEYTNVVCMNDPKSHFPIIAKLVIKVLREIDNEQATA